MKETLDYWDVISKIGFAGGLFVVLVGSYFDVWCWSRDRKKAETDGAFWRERYLETFDVARSAIRAVAPSSRSVGA